MRQKGFRVWKEDKIQTWKPDLIGAKDDEAVVIDVQITTDAGDMYSYHRTKVAKYNDEEVKEHVRSRTGLERVKVTSFTMNWRGIMEKHSIDELLNLGVIRKQGLAVLAVRTLTEGRIAFKMYNRTT